MDAPARSNTLASFPHLQGRRLIVFDGVCVLCSGFAQFVIRRDTEQLYQFAVAQSALGEALYAHYGVKSADYNTNLVIVDGVLHQKLDAFCTVMADMGWPWRSLSVGRHLPLSLKNWLYDRIARNRYQVFGRRDVCLVPDAKLRARLLV